jgi:hypothetical protein
MGTAALLAYDFVDVEPIPEMIVDVIGLHAGDTGTFETTVFFEMDIRGFTSNGCSVVISENYYRRDVDGAREFQLAGDGSCEMPAVGSSGSVTVEPFTFRYPVRFDP